MNLRRSNIRQTRSSLRSSKFTKEQDDVEILSSRSDSSSSFDLKTRKKPNSRRRNKLNLTVSSQDDIADNSNIDSLDSDSSVPVKPKRKIRVRLREGRRIKGRAKLEDAQQSVSGEQNGHAEVDAELKKGRKRIRKIITKHALSSETKTAETIEAERRKRLEERQKFYNKMEDSEEQEKEVREPSSLILEKACASGEPIVQVNTEIVKFLKPHQVQAVHFLWDCLIESLKEHKTHSERINGAVLAHCMGLGKSLSTIAFVHTLLTHSSELNMRTCLILCPVNTLLNWQREWRQWMPTDSEINVYEVVTTAGATFRTDVIGNWNSTGGILLLGYEMYRNLTTTILKRSRKPSFKKLISEALIDPGPDIIVCDEGHLLKNYKAGITKAVFAIKTKKRIVLTGTPLQNSLKEYWNMVDFVKPKLLGSAKEFANRFVNPIQNGQHSNSTERDVQIMKMRSHILFKTLDGCVQRKDYNCLTRYLPPRYEYVLKIRLSEIQRELYNCFLQSRSVKMLAEDREGRSSLFRDKQTFYRICSHPMTLRMQEVIESNRLLLMDTSTEEESLPESPSEEEEEDDDDEEEAEDDDDEEEDEDEEKESEKTPTSTSSHSDGEKSSDETDKSDQRPSFITTRYGRRTRSTFLKENKGNFSKKDSIIDLESSDTDSIKNSAEKNTINLEEIGKDDSSDANAESWWSSLYRDEYDHRIDVGSKLNVLFQIIRKCSDIGDKLLIFSHSLLALDTIEWFLAAIDRQWCTSQGLEVDNDSKQAEKFKKLNEEANEPLTFPSLAEFFSDMCQNTWRRGLDYERIDGSTNIPVRNNIQAYFNGKNKRLRLLIVSTKAGGLGVNLTGANRLIIFDVSWNPSHDTQSIFRSYRFGQTKPVYIYRLLAQGTIEEKIYDRQVTKQSLALRVIDEQQVDRHFSEDDLRELYSFEPDIFDAKAVLPFPNLPKDRLLADLLAERPDLIYNYHNHDSLLENRIDEGLTDLERQEAWREYEEEKRLGYTQSDYQRYHSSSIIAPNPLLTVNENGVYEFINNGVRSQLRPLNSNSDPLYQQKVNAVLDRMFTPIVINPILSTPVPLPLKSTEQQGQRPPHAIRPSFRPIAPRIFSTSVPSSSEYVAKAFNLIRTGLLRHNPLLSRSPDDLNIMASQLLSKIPRLNLDPIMPMPKEENPLGDLANSENLVNNSSSPSAPST